MNHVVGLVSRPAGAEKRGGQGSTPLAKLASASVQQRLHSETQKILTQAIDAKKEREFTDEFNAIYGQIDEVYADTYTCVRAHPLKY